MIFRIKNATQLFIQELFFKKMHRDLIKEFQINLWEYICNS